MWTVKEITDFLIYLGSIAIALAAIGVVIRFMVVRPLQNWIREQVGRPLAKIHDEVTPNGGQSIKDDTQATRSDLDQLKKALDAHLMEDVPRRQEQVDRLTTRLDAHIDHHPGGGA